VDEQPVLPGGSVVRGELLVPADEPVEAGMGVVERLEADAVRRAVDLDPRLVQAGHARDVDVDHGRVRGLTPAVAVRDEAVRVEALQVREAPVLVRRRRQRERTVALEDLLPGHQGCEPSEYGA
jgi:hypothetical protein